MRRPSLGEYLRARRQLVQPEDVGLPRDPARRVAGLRREEVALIASISPDYYLRLEQGRTHQPSDQVLRSLGRALALDDEAVSYMARIARPTPTRSGIPAGAGDPASDASLQGLLAQWSHTPALIIDKNQYIVLANPIARALGAGYFDEGTNLVRTLFAPLTRSTCPDWETTARQSLAALRFTSDPHDPRLQELVHSLSASEPDFVRLWARHDAHPHRTGTARAFIDGIGPIDLTFVNFAVPGHDGHTLTAFFDDPGTPAMAAIAYLAAQGEVVLTHGPHSPLR